MTALSQELELLLDSLRTTQQPDRALLLSAANALARLEAAERWLEEIARLAACEGHTPFYSEACDCLLAIGQSALAALAREETP